MTLPKNYRDVGASLSTLGYNDLPPGFLLRSSAWDIDPEVRWDDIGRPRTILNLREYHSIESYNQLHCEEDDIREEEIEVEQKGTRPSPIQIWQCCAKNDVEKYDLSLKGSRDWLVEILQRIVEDTERYAKSDDQCFGIAILEEAGGDAKISPAYSDNAISISRVVDSNEIDLKEDDCNIPAVLNNPFQSALRVILQRRLSKVHAPLLVHCRFGRDRTGIVVAFLLKMLLPSIPDSIIVKEFLLSDMRYYHGSHNDSGGEMKRLGNMLLQLTLKNMPIVFEELELRHKRVFAGDNFKLFREELSDLTFRLTDLKSPPDPLADLRIDTRYIKSETQYYFRKVATLFKNRTDYVEFHEKCYLLWLCLAYHNSAHSSLPMPQAWNLIETTEKNEKEKKEGDGKDDLVVIMEENIYHLHLRAVMIQLALKLIEEGVEETYPLPPNICNREKIMQVHDELLTDLSAVNDAIDNIDDCPLPLQRRFCLLRHRIKSSSKSRS